MLRKRRIRPAILLMLVLVTGSILTITIASSGTAVQPELVRMSVDTSYNGVEDGSQAIRVEATFTANQRISGLHISVRSTIDSFINGRSYQTRESNVEVIANRTLGDFYVPELRSGQKFSLIFDAYPRDLSRKSLKVATVHLSAENPQTYETTKPIEASIANNNPYKKWRGTGVKLWQWGIAIFLGIVGFVGGGYGGYQLLYGRGKIEDRKEREFIEKLRDLHNEIDKPSDKDEVERLIRQYGGSLRFGGGEDEGTARTGSGDEDDERFPSR